MCNLIKNVAVFDMDGTLALTDAANTAAYRQSLREYGIATVGVRGRITANAIRRMVRGISVADLASISRTKAKIYGRELWRIAPGPAAAALRQVLADRAKFGKVVLLTDSSERRAMETLKFLGWYGLFDEIVCNGGHGDKYVNYFRSHDTDPAASVVWENENDKVLSAIAAGVKIENIRKVA